MTAALEGGEWSAARPGRTLPPGKTRYQSTARPHFSPGKDPVPILQEAVCAPGPVWTGGKSRPRRDSVPDLPTRSSVAMPTELPGPRKLYVWKFLITVMFNLLLRVFIQLQLWDFP